MGVDSQESEYEAMDEETFSTLTQATDNILHVTSSNTEMNSNNAKILKSLSMAANRVSSQLSVNAPALEIQKENFALHIKKVSKENLSNAQEVHIGSGEKQLHVIIPKDETFS